ncbi:MAG: hypothetical protein ACK5Y2_01310 [Bdellovibrionales bacterium]
MKLKWVLGVLLAISSLRAYAAFDENGRRYLSDIDVLWSLQSLFGYEGLNLCSIQIEMQLIQRGRDTSLGQNNLVSGQPASSGPTQSTIATITTCLATLWNEIGTRRPLVELSAVDLFVTGLTEEEYRQVLNSNPSLRSIRNVFWSSLGQDLQGLIVARHIYRILGSDARIQDYGIVDPNILRTQLQNYFAGSKYANQSVKDVSREIFQFLILRDEFLSF